MLLQYFNQYECSKMSVNLLSNLFIGSAPDWNGVADKPLTSLKNYFLS